MSSYTDKEVENIQNEINELETLIKLQYKKIELINKKNEAVKKLDTNDTNDSNNNVSINSNSISKKSKLEMQPRINPLLKASNQDRDEDDDEIKSTKTTTSEIVRKTIAVEQEQQQAMITSIQRMSRLTTDLANERNLLAWTRTSLAAARTSLAFLGVASVSLYGEVMGQIVTISFITVAFISTLHAVQRYKRIKFILMQPEPPLHFDRLSNIPIQAIVATLFLLALVTIASQQWV